MALKLPRLNVSWDSQPGLFERYWNTAMSLIEENVNGISAALTAALAAQGTADGATTDAATAQATATAATTAAAAANVNANTRVQKSLGPTWTNATGTATRTALATYTGQAVSNPPNQAQVQAIDDAVVALSQHVVAIINDLKSNGSLT
jgi:hypothetical protein